MVKKSKQKGWFVVNYLSFLLRFMFVWLLCDSIYVYVLELKSYATSEQFLVASILKSFVYAQVAFLLASSLKNKKEGINNHP